MPGTSYRSLQLQDMLTKRGKKIKKDGINRGDKPFSKFLKCFFLVKYEK